MRTKASLRGFTLIELMVVVTIIGILAAISYPSYQNYIIKTRRVEAMGLMLELTSFMERIFTETGAYTEGATLPFTSSPKDGGNAQYILGFSSAPDATSYTISATPQGNQAVGDTDCATVTIDQANTKCILGGSTCSGSGATAAVIEAVADCW